MDQASRIKLLSLCIGICICYAIFYNLISDSQRMIHSSTVKNQDQVFWMDSQNKILKPTITNSTNHIKQFKILAWTGSRYGQDWNMTGTKPFETCKYSNCYGTTDKNEYNSSDVILFQMRMINAFPKHRFPFQKWVMHMHESPMWEKSYSKWNNLFNATWTYKRTSDIWTNYSHPGNLGGLFKKTSHSLRNLTLKNYALGKTKPIAWLVSDCPKSKMFRINYAKKLQNFIPVDIYGHCGPLKCGPRFVYGKGQVKTTCLELLEKRYKFYLSFENSLCDDYVSEKLWTALRLNIVPIVLGAYNYSELLPPKTYIDIKDYSSPKELAEYLHMLDTNDTLYNEYLQRKDMYKIVPHAPFQCSVCEYINKLANETKNYDRLDLFWNKKLHCYKPNEFYKNIDPKVWND